MNGHKTIAVSLREPKKASFKGPESGLVKRTKCGLVKRNKNGPIRGPMRLENQNGLVKRT